MTNSPPMVLPSAMASLWVELAELVRSDQLAQEHRLAMLVRQFDADHVAALDHRDAG